MLKSAIRKITKDQSRDTGMAMVLLLLLLQVISRREAFLFGAIALHVLNMTVPQMFRPVAVVWLWVSHILGMIVQKIILSLVFFVVVTPVGIWRKLAGKDSLKLRAFQGGDESVMLERHHIFNSADMEKPY